MIRWRCHRRACRKSGYARRTTKEEIAPECRRCGHLMRIDHYRTSKKEKRKGICYCHVVSYPHQHSYCQKKERDDYAASLPALPDPEVPF